MLNRPDVKLWVGYNPAERVGGTVVGPARWKAWLKFGLYIAVGAPLLTTPFTCDELTIVAWLQKLKTKRIKKFSFNFSYQKNKKKNCIKIYLIRPLLSEGVSNFDEGANDSGDEDRVLLGKLARLVSGANDVRDDGGVSSLLPGSDLTGVLEKWSKLARTSVCCNYR